MDARDYTIRVAQVHWDVWEFETRNADGDVVSTVRMAGERARSLGLLPA